MPGPHVTLQLPDVATHTEQLRETSVCTWARLATLASRKTLQTPLEHPGVTVIVLEVIQLSVSESHVRSSSYEHLAQTGDHDNLQTAWQNQVSSSYGN